MNLPRTNSPEYLDGFDPSGMPSTPKTDIMRLCGVFVMLSRFACLKRKQGANRLINIVDLGSFKRAILLTVNGSTCSAEVDFELKPGFSDYEFKRNNGKTGIARSVTARRLNCSVGPS